MKSKNIVKWMGIALLAIIFLSSIALGLFIHSLNKKPEIDDSIRESLPGHTVILSDGKTYYEDHGPKDGPVLFTFHGSTVFHIIWERNIKALTNAGFRVITYDQYGRGYSDRPKIQYTGDLYNRQAEELLEHLNIEGPIHIAGISMGGGLALLYAQRHPEQVESLTLISSVGPNSTNQSLGEVISRLRKRLFKSEEEREFDAKRREKIASLLTRTRMQFDFRGVEMAYFSAIRNRKRFALRNAYEAVAELKLPTLMIWGDEDTVIPIETSNEILRYFPQTEFHKVAGAGHASNWEKSEEVNPILIEFLSTIEENKKG